MWKFKKVYLDVSESTELCYAIYTILEFKVVLLYYYGVKHEELYEQKHILVLLIP